MAPRPRLLPQPPSGALPPLARLSSYTSIDILHALQNLRDLYFSPLLPSKWDKIILPRHNRLVFDNVEVPDSGYASAEEDGDEDADGSDAEADMDSLRADAMERTFAIRWLTSFLSRGPVWAEADVDETETANRYEIIDEVSSLLSSFSGISEEEPTAITRSFSFPLNGGRERVHVELNDEPLSQEDHTSVGLQSWASSILLAERMCASPLSFGLHKDKPLRILELGAGTGLLSIVASKLLSLTATIVATDYHPDVLRNLETNVRVNSCSSMISVRHLDWENPVYEGILDQPFDIVLAADVVYHVDHAKWIKGVVERVLAKPTSSHKGEFWLVIPLRTIGRHEGMETTVDKVFSAIGNEGLMILDKKQLDRQKNVGRADEGGYRLFRIGWP